MKKRYIFIFACVIFLLFVKITTTIYVGDYSGITRYNFDIKIKIDDKEILNDSLTSNFPYLANFAVNEKLRYGLHKINIYSDRASVNQKKRILLLPFQHIFIEFLPADTLTWIQYNFPDSILRCGILQFPDSVIELYKTRDKSKEFLQKMFFPNSTPTEMDSIYLSIEAETLNRKSSFDIRTIFNPFRLE